MLTVVKIFEIFLPLVFIGTTVIYIYDFIKSTHILRVMTRIALMLCGVLQLSYLMILGMVYHRHPVMNEIEFLSMTVLGVALIYGYLEYRFQSRSMGPWILGFATILQTVASVIASHSVNSIPENVSGFAPAIHTMVAMMAYSSLLISAVFSIMYLILYRSLRKKKFGFFFERFLPLRTMGEMNFQSLIIGFSFFTLVIPMGFYMVGQAFSELVWDFKYCMVLFSWLVYFVCVLTGWLAGWRGNRLAIFSIFALVILIIGAGLAFTGEGHSVGGNAQQIVTQEVGNE